MSEAAPSISLAVLDEPHALAPEPAILTANLAALREVQDELAAHVEAVAPPAPWRPVHALDGTATYRVEAAGQPPQWLDGTATPRVRARALLSSYEPGPKNPALPDLLTGAELLRLLEILPPHLAVFVFVAELGTLRALLTIHDLTDPLRAGRCVFLPPEREAEILGALLERHPGLAPPATILLADLVDASRIALVKQVCETVGSAVNQQRAARLQGLLSSGTAPPSDTSRAARSRAIAVAARRCASHRM